MHSFCAKPTADNKDWIMTVTDYAGQRYISAIEKGNVVGTQFHPEKSGAVGLAIIGSFLARSGLVSNDSNNSMITLLPNGMPDLSAFPMTQLAKRVIACLDVRSNDAGDLVVTKGDQYDVREESDVGEK